MASQSCYRCDGYGWIRGKRFRNGRSYSTARVCELCEGKGSLLPLDGLLGLLQERAESVRQDLEEQMRKPLPDISKKSGEIERNSPLFHGTGDNPTLF